MPDRKRAKLKPAVSWAFLAVLAVLAFVVFVRLRLAGVPLERDEGEYAYAGRLILEGIPPYSIAYNMKFPGTYCFNVPAIPSSVTALAYLCA